MPNFISFVALNFNTSTQNAGVYIGQTNISGFDANMKMNLGNGSNFSLWSISNMGSIMANWDGMEGADGVIIDTDMKPDMNGQV